MVGAINVHCHIDICSVLNLIRIFSIIHICRIFFSQKKIVNIVAFLVYIHTATGPYSYCLVVTKLILNMNYSYLAI